MKAQKFFKYFVPVIALAFVGCAKQAENQEKTDAKAEAKTETPAQTCELKFEEKFSNAEKDNKSVSFYVSNFGGAKDDACWNKVEDYAQTVTAEKGKNTKVFFFNCPHHTTEVKAADFKLEGEYRDYCVAWLDITPDGKKTFTKLPYDKKSS